jgi:hypothetical protein
MLDVLQILCLVLVALALVPVLTHALELPGKLLLEGEAYVAVRPRFDTEFSVAGFAERLAVLSAMVLLAVTPREGLSFWLTLVAVVGLLAAHAVRWLFSHPVSDRWERSHVARAGLASVSFFVLAVATALE